MELYDFAKRAIVRYLRINYHVNKWDDPKLAHWIVWSMRGTQEAIDDIQ